MFFIMNKVSLLGNRVYGYNMYRDLLNAEYVQAELPEIKESEVVDPNKSLFDIVFSVDPLTTLPVGDIAMFMSDNVSPDVKRFIELNLHSPVSCDGDSAGDFSDLSDDDIVQFSRGHNESIADYRQRLYDFVINNQKSVLSSNDK